jgi:hypothetical protein
MGCGAMTIPVDAATGAALGRRQVIGQLVRRSAARL